MKHLTAALLLAGCAHTTTGSSRFHQATALPNPAPVFAPRVPRPSHLPAGAGASPLGQPWQQPGVQVERSPNRRILPPTPEPGLWASDAVEASRPTKYNDMPAMLSGVRLPAPKGESTDATRRCAATMNNALWGARLHEAMARLDSNVRTCIAARLFEYCAIRRAFKLHKKLVTVDVDSSRALARWEEAVGVAVMFVKSTCDEQSYPREAADLYNKAADEWARQNRMTKEDP